MPDPFGQLASVSSAGKGDIREVTGVEGEPDWGCHETRVVVVGSGVVVGLLSDLLLESGDLGLEEEDTELMEALPVLDGGREPLGDLDCVTHGAFAVSEDVESRAW